MLQITDLRGTGLPQTAEHSAGMSQALNSKRVVAAFGDYRANLMTHRPVACRGMCGADDEGRKETLKGIAQVKTM